VTDNLPRKLAEHSSKGYVIAPAGYGKTHLIALAVREAKHRQLILTHTFAGVNSIKAKMNLLGVSSALYQVDTIASWILRLCLSYPKTSGWSTENPSSKQWSKLYESGCDLLEKEFIRNIVCATYTGLYVDEYQDCSEQQHSLVSTLADSLPCRILGDPLQAIFDFADKPVDWGSSIYPHFSHLGDLEIPWRWRNAGAYELGEWLDQARKTLMKGNMVELTKTLPKGITRISVDLSDYTNPNRHSRFYDFLKDDSTVIAIYPGDQKSKYKSHKLAQSLAGKFSSIEEVEAKDLFVFLRKFEKETSVTSKFLLMLDFARKCCTGINKIITAGTKRGDVTRLTKATKYPEILEAANLYLCDPNSRHLNDFFYLLKNCGETSTYRRDLLNRFLAVLKISIDINTTTLLESAHLFQREFRHSGRPVRHKKLIGTTLLVKGLEYDHAIIVDADSLSIKEFYVAITRGSKSLTIFTK